MQQKILPIKKNNRTTFNYTKQKKQAEKKRQEEKEKRRNFEYKVAMSSIGIEVIEDA